jgi:hypothetical protein
MDNMQKETEELESKLQEAEAKLAKVLRMARVCRARNPMSKSLAELVAFIETNTEEK